MQCNAIILAHKLPSIDNLVAMATVIIKKVLNEFLLTQCKDQTIKFTKKFRIKGNTLKMNKPKAELTSIINEVGSSQEIINIERQIKELVDKNVAKALKNRKNYNILEDERPIKAFLNLVNTKGGYKKVILLKQR